MYEVEEISIADTDRLYRYKDEGIRWASFSLKGFEYPWILSSHKWHEGERVLDVGAGYSSLTDYLRQSYGCEGWNVDDFGLSSDDELWTRGREVQTHIDANPELTFVRERLGDPATSSLPEASFDVIVSASALEHVPAALAPRVWKHMDRLLKPGGVMLHAIDIGFASNYSLPRLLAHYVAKALHSSKAGLLGRRLDQMRSKEFAFAPRHGASMVRAAALIDLLGPLLPARLRYGLASGSPRAYARMALESLGIHPRLDRRALSVTNFVLNPRTVSASYNEGYELHRNESLGIASHRRTGALLIRVRKSRSESVV